MRPLSRSMKLEDTTLGWRFVNPLMKAQYGVDSMSETGENVAEEFGISRTDQDAFAYRSQQRAAFAERNGMLAAEITPVTVLPRKGPPMVVEQDEHPRPDTTLEALAALKPIVKPNGTITAGNASGRQRWRLRAVAGLGGRGQAIWPDSRRRAWWPLRPPASRLASWGSVRSGDPQGSRARRSHHRRHGCDRTERSVCLAGAGGTSRTWESPTMLRTSIPMEELLRWAILLGASGARLVISAVRQLQRTGGRYALCTMCIGVGQGIAMILERV